MPTVPTARILLLLATAVLWVLPRNVVAQSSGDQSWNSNTQQQDPRSSNLNPIRTHETHTESNGRTIDHQTIDALGPDGNYVPYRDIERESVRVDANTVRTVERSYGRGPDGERILVQETREDAHSSPDGDRNVTRTTLNPDGNGTLQVIQRESETSRQTGPGVQQITTTVSRPDINGGMAPALQVSETRKQASDGTIDFKRSTMLPDGSGGFQLGEVKEGTIKSANGEIVSKDERISRPDSNGNLSVVERTKTQQADNGPGEKRQTTDTFSVNVTGNAPDGSLHLVQRDTAIQRSNAAGVQTTTRRVEQPNPGSPSEGLQVTQQTVNTVRRDLNGIAQQQTSTFAPGSNGSLGAVWVDFGSTTNPAALQVETKSPSGTTPTGTAQTAPGSKASANTSNSSPAPPPQK